MCTLVVQAWPRILPISYAIPVKLRATSNSHSSQHLKLSSATFPHEVCCFTDRCRCSSKSYPFGYSCQMTRSWTGTTKPQVFGSTSENLDEKTMTGMGTMPTYQRLKHDANITKLDPHLSISCLNCVKLSLRQPSRANFKGCIYLWNIYMCGFLQMRFPWDHKDIQKSPQDPFTDYIQECYPHLSRATASAQTSLSESPAHSTSISFQFTRSGEAKYGALEIPARATRSSSGLTRMLDFLLRRLTCIA